MTIFDAVQHDHPGTAVPEHQENRMTEQPARDVPYLARLHVDLACVGAEVQAAEDNAVRAIEHARGGLGKLGPAFAAFVRIAKDPHMQAYVDAYIDARNAGVAEGVFRSAVHMLKGAVADLAGQPAPADPAATSAELPAVTGTPDGTGPQPAADSVQA